MPSSSSLITSILNWSLCVILHSTSIYIGQICSIFKSDTNPYFLARSIKKQPYSMDVGQIAICVPTCLVAAYKLPAVASDVLLSRKYCSAWELWFRRRKIKLIGMNWNFHKCENSTLIHSRC